MIENHAMQSRGSGGSCLSGKALCYWLSQVALRLPVVMKVESFRHSIGSADQYFSHTIPRIRSLLPGELEGASFTILILLERVAVEGVGGGLVSPRGLIEAGLSGTLLHIRTGHLKRYLIIQCVNQQFWFNVLPLHDIHTH